MAIGYWVAYQVGKSIHSTLGAAGQPRGGGPVREGTEVDFRADEARFAKDEARIEAEIAAAKKKRL
jgi:hypothetical protein